MKKELLNKDVQSFIQRNLGVEPTKLILKGSPFQDIKIQELAEQITSKRKCEIKLPTWFKADQIYYPNRLNIEQTSSEITAEYKSGLISGNSMIDITGGFGVDSFYFSKRFENVVHCEINTELSLIVSHNFKQLQVRNIRTIATDGLEFLNEQNQNFDWIYADPSRRNEIKAKVFLLKDCLPNIPKYLDHLFTYSDQILLKISPLLDLSSTIKELKFVKEIHVVAVNNEVKELIFILKKGYKKKIHIKTANIKKGTTDIFESILESQAVATFSMPDIFLYEPNSAILKSGIFNEVSHQLNINKLNINSHLYTNNILVKFPGRRFRIRHIIPFDKKHIKRLIPSRKANITRRNFPLSVDQIRKKTGLKDGGDDYLFFTTDINNKRIVLICEKV